MTNGAPNGSSEKTLKELSQFENFFHKSNLQLGFRMWIRVYGIWFIAAFTLVLVGLLSVLGSFGLLLLVGLQCYLFQWAAANEARRLYGMAVLGSCWWSIVWRINLYMLPVWFVFSLMMPEGYSRNFELIEQNPQPFLMAQIILLLLSVIPMGMVTSQAFLKSFERIQMLRKVSIGNQTAGGDNEQQDTEEKDEDRKAE